jgi:hypothetical protein
VITDMLFTPNCFCFKSNAVDDLTGISKSDRYFA